MLLSVLTTPRLMWDGIIVFVHVLWTKIITFTLWVVLAILSTTLPKKLDKCFVRYADNSVMHQIEILQLCM